MQARFLLGPAGSGKTHRCLAEIRAELLRSPEGLPLILLAPKQATFQLERQLLSDPELPGYTRLQILSFDRLADFIVGELMPAPPDLLGEEGRVMVLRALLARHHSRLKLFHATARLPGFAQQLSLLLRELQQHGVRPDSLPQLSARVSASSRLPEKLQDLALLLRAYLDWLREHRLQDADCLLELAAETLKTQSSLRIGGLWLDGFAEMTPQETRLLTAVVPRCECALLAFCLEAAPGEDPSWLSTWSVVGQTFRRCHLALAALPGCRVEVEVLERKANHGRFAGNPVLQHLEWHWTEPKPFPATSSRGGATTAVEPAGPVELETALRLVICANPEAEAVLAAREILAHARAGGRYRDCAVLLRRLNHYQDTLRRVFARYRIPVFLDRREAVAHHPLAELTRFALRTVAFGWRQEDWFGALKTGFVTAGEGEIDELENAALARGWQGRVWHSPLSVPDNPELAGRLERLREKILPPFESLAAAVAAGSEPVSGEQLAAALRTFWESLRVEQTLRNWARENEGDPQRLETPGQHAAVHATVRDQMQVWLDNLALAFSSDALALRDWLPILEAGLAGLTVGVIPPALDQVLIGAIDRSRNPELKLVILPGLNEGVFPAAPAPANLLSDSDRAELDRHNLILGPDTKRRLGHERFYGYIACTRARERLVLTCSMRDGDGHPLNTSPFIPHIQRLFPGLRAGTAPTRPALAQSVHACEAVAPLLKGFGSVPQAVESSLRQRLPRLMGTVERLRRLQGFDADESLPPALAEQLYGPKDLVTSVSRIEQFAACPFKFFVHSGLRAEERERFEVDARERGSFQHEVLARFHEEVREEGRRWRDLDPSEARERIGRIAATVAAQYRGGLFQASDASLFAARGLTRALQDFIETVITWMRTAYGFDPRAVELSFGGEDDALGPWVLPLDGGHRMLFRGKIDRVDLAADPASDRTLCVVVDYKSGAKRIDPLLLEHGIQIQLPAYLAVLRRFRGAREILGVEQVAPAGVFYVGLRGQYERGDHRDTVLAGADSTRQLAYRHSGRFSFAALPHLDRQWHLGGSGQFSYALTKAGKPNLLYKDLLEEDEFQKLLDQVERQLIAMGRQIFAGVVKVDPYRKANEVACARCDYRSICRIDPWTHRYRVLRKQSAPAG